MRVLLVENERPAAEKLKCCLMKIDGTIEICAMLETVEATVNWLQQNTPPDLLLLDIQLDDGLCFEIFETINLSIPVIFTTAYNDYLLKAFRVNSVDYLLKPIEEDALLQAINKFKTIHNQMPSDVLKQLMNDMQKSYKTRFLIKVGIHYRSISIDEICCFYILERASFIQTFQGKNYTIDHSLDYLQTIVDPQKYFRINRHCLINIDGFTDIIRYSASRLQLKLKIAPSNPELFVISRDKVNAFKNWIDR